MDTVWTRLVGPLARTRRHAGVSPMRHVYRLVRADPTRSGGTAALGPFGRSVGPGGGKPGFTSRLVELAYTAAWGVVRALPRSATWWAFAGVANLAARRRGPGVRSLTANLRMVVGSEVSSAELDDLVRRALHSYARYWQEAYRLPTHSSALLRDGFRLEGEDILREHVAAGTGVVLAGSHAGNWDAFGGWIAAKKWPVTSIGVPLEPASVYKKFVASRESLGIEIITLTGGPPSPLDVLAERLSAGAVVGLLADVNPSERGVEVTFFGRRTQLPPGPAMLALITGAPLYVVDMWYESERPVGRLRGPIDVPTSGPLHARIREMTQSVADRMAAGIACHPVDWHMLHAVQFSDPLDAPNPARADAG